MRPSLPHSVRLPTAVLLVVTSVLVQGQGPYRHERLGLQFDVPQGWTFNGNRSLTGGAEQTRWTVKSLGTTVYAWMNSEKNDASQVAQRLDAVVETKVAERRASNYRNYRIRPASVQRTEINGRPAELAIADFETRSGQRVVEFLAWVYSENSHVFVFAPTTPDQNPAQVAELQTEFDAFVNSARLQ